MDKIKSTKEDFELESGLPDDFDAQISSATFGFKAEYRDGKCRYCYLNLKAKKLSLRRPRSASEPIGNNRRGAPGRAPQGQEALRKHFDDRSINRTRG